MSASDLPQAIHGIIYDVERGSEDGACLIAAYQPYYPVQVIDKALCVYLMGL